MRIRQIAMLLAFLLAITVFPVSATGENVWKEFYVSVSGSDTNPGTKELPFKTIGRAKEAVADVNNEMQGDIVVNIGGGYYYLDEMLDFGVADSGKNGNNVIYRGEEGNMPVISGGKQVTGFTPSSEYPGIYQAKLSGVERVAAIFVNEERRFMAKAEKMLTGVKKPDKYNTDEWYAANPNDVKDDYNYYDPNTPYSYDGFYMSKEDIGFYENADDIIMTWGEAWKSQAVSVKSIEPNPDNEDQVIVRMDEGIWHLAVAANSGYEYHPRSQEPFVMMNAMELLDTPGEFYYNRKTETLYYMPIDGEDMASANVIVPVLEQMIYIMGNDVDEKVENITFEGLKIAHSAWYGWQEGYLGEQGHMMRAVNDALFTFVYPYALGCYAVTPSSVIVQMAENVNFYDNYFFGMGGTALDMPNGVENCDVIGNAFSDLGDGAIYLDNTMTMDTYLGTDGVSDVPPEGSGQLCLNNMFYHKVASSYLGTSSTNLRNAAGLNRDQDINLYPEDKYKTYVDEYHYYNAWQSNPLAASRGEKAWVRYDFIRKYEIDKITLAFDPDYVTDELKTGYEVLVSNDKHFTEGNYVVVATQETPASEVVEYNVDLTEKYRYVMIRTLGGTQFALSRCWVFTPDVEPMTKYERCRNVKIENNYVERYGLDILRATGIMSFYAENISVKHNEVIDGVYSGMNFGWGWSSEARGPKNNDYSYNYLHNVNQILHDGGGIYTLGRHENSKMTHNFIDGNGVGPRAYYSDQGTAGLTYEYNAAEDMSFVYCPYHPSIIDNSWSNFYGSHNIINLYSAPNSTIVEDNILIETPNTYVSGQPSKEAYAIIEEAGLELQYEHIRDWVPKMENNLHDRLELYNDAITTTDLTYKKAAITDEINGMLNDGVFGDGLGMFSIADYYKLKEAKEGYDNASSSRVREELLQLEEAIAEVKYGIKRYSLADTIALAKETIDNARVVADDCPCLTASNKIDVVDTMGMDLASNVDTFKKQVEEIEKKAQSADTKQKEYDLLIQLEAAYNDFMGKRLSADITYLWVDGATKVEIHEETGKINVFMPIGAKLGETKYEIYVKGNAEIARSMPDKLDLSKEFTIPMYCEANDTYKYWTVTAENDNGINTNVSKDSSWFTKSNFANPVYSLSDSVLLKANPYVYMTNSYNKAINGVEVNFMPISKNEINDFTFIVGADNYADVELTNSDAKNNRYEVVFGSGSASLYSVTGGTKKLLATNGAVPNYNQKNNFTYSFTQINNSTQLIVTLNGETIFNELISGSVTGRYFGCYSDKVNIKIY